MFSFSTKDIPMPKLDFKTIEIWLEEIANDYDKNVGNLNYLFCDDEEILRINREFLQHDYFTDIITFDYSIRGRVAGDIFISVDTVRSNAEELNIPFNNELLRVISHGLLHLCGIDDKGPGEREIMEAEENKALELWANLTKDSIG